MKHALIFAAGRGERMRPLTDRTPKPLLSVGGKSLIVWHLERLAAAGWRHVVINTSHLADQFRAELGDGARWSVHIDYLYEGDTPLETGGGMLNALPLLGGETFLAINGDIWCDVELSTLPAEPRGVAHLLVVDNPDHHPEGDFALDSHGLLHATGTPKLTFSGIGLYRPTVLLDWKDLVADRAAAQMPPRFKLAPLLCAAMTRDAVTGAHHTGTWMDVGTPERWQTLDASLRRIDPGHRPD
ncbi:MAG: N-acetylmuramate alpha-1-phosphate uridylyltransferase MurU [Rhodanobacter sp.]